MNGGTMSDEGFFRRWSRLKSTGAAPEAPAEAPREPPPAPAPLAEPAALRRDEAEAAPRARLPTLDDAARLTPDADFSAFVARDVDKTVQRLALKKLFADPHFNTIDGLDIYMSDYNKASPLAPGMLASLKHAPGVLDRLLGDRQEERQEELQEELQEKLEAAGTAQVEGPLSTQLPLRETGAADTPAEAPAPAHAAGPAHAQEHEPGQPSIRQGNA